ncbi:MAG: YkgJ family cysteine cluster protein [Candidatus Magnetomorum sp.]|nr:YkgJ family cysteine cluster protein [Candidatus Magnetomorum sp.]
MSMANISPVKLSLDSKFSFDCRKDLECFTKCCRDINIILTPYDIIRMKNRLELSSDEFLAIYTTPQLLDKTDLPVITLKMLDDEEKSCPFVREDGCLIYTDRPITCRYYPLGSGTLAHKEDTDDQQGFFFFINEPHCKGFDKGYDWTVREWRKDQNASAYDEINAGWYDLMVMKRSFPPTMHLTEKAKKLFFIASYNIDAFHRFVFESDFIQLYTVDENKAQEMRDDEIKLFTFGQEWLKWVLYKKGEFSLNTSLAEKRSK